MSPFGKHRLFEEQVGPLAKAVLLLLLTSACAATRPAEPPTPREPSAAASAGGPDAEHRLRDYVQHWQGTPFVYGGDDRRGLDCSAFVQHVYADVYGVEVPRTTAAQARTGEPVPADALRTGDLVFFRPPKTRHVGVYLSDGEFAHVSSSRGVTISHIDQRYWRDAYWTSRRLLPSPRPPVAASDERPPAPRRVPETLAADQPAAGPAEGRRVGW